MRVEAGDDQQENTNRSNLPGAAGDSKHKNFGKVPKYLEKYKEEADELAKKRAEIRAKR